jgi:hypothetical protein
MRTDADYKILEAIATLEDATNQIYNIEGDRWQMAYDVLEGLLSNLKIEVPREEEYDGQPDEAQEWHDFDPDC